MTLDLKALAREACGSHVFSDGGVCHRCIVIESALSRAVEARDAEIAELRDRLAQKQDENCHNIEAKLSLQQQLRAARDEQRERDWKIADDHCDHICFTESICGQPACQIRSAIRSGKNK